LGAISLFTVNFLSNSFPMFSESSNYIHILLNVCDSM
jgi:hypothetical protein